MFSTYQHVHGAGEWSTCYKSDPCIFSSALYSVRQSRPVTQKIRSWLHYITNCNVYLSLQDSLQYALLITNTHALNWSCESICRQLGVVKFEIHICNFLGLKTFENKSDLEHHRKTLRKSCNASCYACTTTMLDILFHNTPKRTTSRDTTSPESRGLENTASTFPKAGKRWSILHCCDGVASAVMPLLCNETNALNTSY